MSLENTFSRSDLLPTPPPPHELSHVELSENSRQVLSRRYLRRDENGQPMETPEQMFWRVAYHIAKVDDTYTGNIMITANEFYQIMASRRFFPNSPTFTGAGTPLGQLAACFVLPISDDMGRRSTGIFQTLRDAALIQQTGGGNGFSFSALRPKYSHVNSSAGQATGPVGFLHVYDNAFGEIAQGGTRRGANMATLRVDHPDIEDFIDCKTNENHITNFNTSVSISDAFMRAVENDEDWILHFPDVHHPSYRNFEGSFEKALESGIPLIKHKTLRARDLFTQIVRKAQHNGEPGLLFVDTANRTNPLPHLYSLESTNPCGEQWLGPYENCCLGSINLAQFCAPQKEVAWESLRKTIEIATHFLDNVIDANHYVPAVPQLKKNALRARRIGLGIMGLADLMLHVGIRYGSEQGQEFAAQVVEFLRYHAMMTSMELAKKRGPFPAITGSVYDPQHLTWQPPNPVHSFQQDWRRPVLDWEGLERQIRTCGIRNAAQTTIAPTGTIGTVAGCEGYGCEPIFALAYIRHVNDNGKDLALTYISPAFEKALIEYEIPEEKRRSLIEQVIREGTCQHVEELPKDLRKIFVASQDISAEEHVRMQAAMQAFVDNSISKTINFPPNATEEDIAHAFLLTWQLGCKGITVYVTGSREKEVLETFAGAEQKEKQDKSTSPAPKTSPVWMIESENHPVTWTEAKKPRPRYLPGLTYGIETPVGKTFITINENGSQQPFEVFINTAKAGSDVAADSEAIARLISLLLRISSPIEPSQRLHEVWRQLSGLGGGRPMGFGPHRVRSMPDGVAQVLAEYMESRLTRLSNGESMRVNHLFVQGEESEEIKPEAWEQKRDQYILKIGDLCPECGQASMVNEEGCRKCYGCGYSEC